MANYKTLKDFLNNNSPDINELVTDGAPINPNEFPLCGIRVAGAVLFADLPGYSRRAEVMSPVESAFMINHFFAWIETAAIERYGGVVDKFIGDEVMIVFAAELHDSDPLESALWTARKILESDHFGFDPKIGIAEGQFFIAKVGTKSHFDVSAIGHIVNLAARCVASAESITIKVATNDRALVENVFLANLQEWQISGPTVEKFKNIKEVQVITIARTTVMGFRLDMTSGEVIDYDQMVRQLVQQAIERAD